MPWTTSDRRTRLPKNWRAIRRQVAARAGYQCQATQHAPGCNRIGSECDHVIRGDNHDLNNLLWLSHPCHLAKTLTEAAQARAARPNTRLPDETHPAARTRNMGEPRHDDQPPGGRPLDPALPRPRRVAAQGEPEVGSRFFEGGDDAA